MRGLGCVGSDKLKSRIECINIAKLNIIGIAETHLKHGDEVESDDYLWFGQNRRDKRKGAWSGSGGVGFFVDKQIAENFNIQILDVSHEGIMWIQLTSLVEDSIKLAFCVCYLL